MPIEDVFYLYEGVLNADHTEFFESIQNVQTVSADFSVEVYQDAQGEYFIEYADFVGLYGELSAQIDQEIDSDEDEAFVIADLTLTSINEGTAEMTMTLYAGIAMNALYYTPSGAVYAAVSAGWCVSQTGNVDAADFLRSYAISQTYHAQNPCPSGQNKYGIFVHEFSTYYPNQIQNPQSWQDDVYPFFWKSNTNDCIGDDNNHVVNNDIWYGWYNKMDYLINYELPYAQSQNANAELYHADWHSHDDQLPSGGHSGNMYGSQRYFHGGRFVYADCGCI